jgi:hypothetical protein
MLPKADEQREEQAASERALNSAVAKEWLAGAAVGSAHDSLGCTIYCRVELPANTSKKSMQAQSNLFARNARGIWTFRSKQSICSQCKRPNAAKKIITMYATTTAISRVGVKFLTTK